MQLVLVTGPPGTGKSTIADVAARHLGGPVFAWDWVMAGIRPFAEVQDAIEALPRQRHRAVGWSILWNLARAHCRRGGSAVLDGVAREIEVAGFRALAAEVDATALVVATSCSDETVHRARIEDRVRAIPGWYELDWDHVAATLAAWIPPRDADLHLDASDPLAANAARLLERLHD